MTSEMQRPCDTLKILHLPPYLSDENRNELFQRYGAVKTRTLRLSQKYTITFAKFPSEEAATEAFLRLHQIKVRDRYLSVEFAKNSMPLDISESKIVQDEEPKDETDIEVTNKVHFKNFLHRLNSWIGNQAFFQPPPPNIRYKYRPPTKNTLLRIAIQLLKEPVFYTQVLHLMNRLNLPPPFEELESEFPVLKEVYDMNKYKDIFGKDIANMETKDKTSEDDEEESEMESEEENSAKHLEVIPVKRKKLQATKKLKIPKFVNPMKQNTSSSIQKVIKPEDVFETVQHGEIKNLKIELKTVDKLLDEANRVAQDKLDDTQVADSGFGIIVPPKSTEDPQSNTDTEDVQKQKFISSEELHNNRISINDQKQLPVFKNYHPGKPSNRLYIKNLAKQVEEDDLHFIYRRYILPESKDRTNEYNVRLMQEGRMKGQAFIMLQNVAQAQMALDETNGYILKNKPMVVQFAKATNS